MKIKLLFICLVLVSVFFGCNEGQTSSKRPEDKGADAAAEEAVPGGKTEASVNKMENFTLLEKEAGAYEAGVTEYNLGSMEYTAQSGKVMPFQLRGVMGVPKGEGTFPLVLITHGSHSNMDESLRFDTGFSYLVESLAKSGYIAVSMDMSSAYIWKYGDADDKEKSVYIAGKQIESLKSANEGIETAFPLSLKGKIDFSNMALVGHSRGGDTIFDIAEEEKTEGLLIKALLSVAPTMPTDIESKEWPEAAVSVLVPEYDGDVVSLDGFAVYTLLEEKADKLHAVTLLRRANHNYFNTEIKSNDAELARQGEELADQIPAEKQQAFLAQYAADFFQASLKGNNEDTLYDNSRQMPNQMYGLDVANRMGSGRDEILFSASHANKLIADGTEVSAIKDSWFFEEDEAVLDSITFGNEAHKVRDFVNIQWQKKGGAVSVMTEESDFSVNSALSFAIVTDPASSQNDGWESQCFTLVLKDLSGNTAAVTLPDNLNALSKTPGKLDSTPLEDMEIEFWSHPSPVMSVRVPLKEFEGVDLGCIDSVSLVFDQTDSGSVYLENIKLE